MELTNDNIEEVLSTSLTQSDHFDWTSLKEQLAVVLNDIADRDFGRLLNVLYRIDISETTVKKALKEQSEDTNIGVVLADLIIQRQKEKMEWRKKYRDWTKNQTDE